MKLDLDSQTIDIPCPECGKKVKERIGRLKNSPTLTCIRGHSFKVDAQGLRTTIEKIKRELDKVGAAFRKFGK